MVGFIIRVLIVAAGLWVAAHIVPGIHYNTDEDLLLAAFLLGIVNAIIRPILVILTFPITIITLGLFLLVINGLMLELVAFFLHGFQVHGLIAAITGRHRRRPDRLVASWFIGPSGRWETIPLISRRAQAGYRHIRLVRDQKAVAPAVEVDEHLALAVDEARAVGHRLPTHDAGGQHLAAVGGNLDAIDVLGDRRRAQPDMADRMARVSSVQPGRPHRRPERHANPIAEIGVHVLLSAGRARGETDHDAETG